MKSTALLVEAVALTAAAADAGTVPLARGDCTGAAADTAAAAAGACTRSLVVAATGFCGALSKPS